VELDRLDFDWLDFDWLDFEAEDFAFRRSLRCVLLIASTNSSFRIPCQPEMP
jgi:hypothetical protein